MDVALIPNSINITNHMYKNILCLFMLLFLSRVGAQQNLDSLYNVWQDTSKTDSTRVNAFYDHIWEGYLFSQPDSAFVLANQLFEFSRDEELQEGYG